MNIKKVLRQNFKQLQKPGGGISEGALLPLFKYQSI
ncbi:hypothetical protein SAMN06265218_109171 [Fodinibius sediminis]|uniref:Uncharacterized protein n=1 Tax=Fodinibius sediminis TaxID=1214077 RepID=A0A521DC94_9BACT|nr:hypothetical protein SAMN06265218_109171 [Fodinibius sediminis]